MNPFQKKKKKAYKIIFDCSEGRGRSTIVWGNTAEQAAKTLDGSYATHIYIQDIEELKNIPQ